MPNLNSTRMLVLDFFMYELKSMIREAKDADHVPAPDMKSGMLDHLTTDQKNEVEAKLIDLAKFIRNTQ